VVDVAHSSVNFSVKHVISNTKGNVAIDTGFINLQNTSGPKIFIELDMSSLNTQNSYRDSHLKDKAEFFEVARHKTAVFAAEKVMKNEGEGGFGYVADGKLTLKGVTRDVKLFFNFEGSGRQEYTDEKNVAHKMEVLGFEGETVINRHDFGITGSSVSDDVKIEINLEAYKERTDW
jgi:polyisoprenoid-binding protein YceI